jgi:UDP-N-acetyl-D-glucosamine dehydrogenase
VHYHDPLIPVVPGTREYAALEGLTSAALDSCKWDGAIVVTDHDALDSAVLLAQSAVVIDTRNLYGGSRHPEAGKRIFVA